MPRNVSATVKTTIWDCGGNLGPKSNQEDWSGYDELDTKLRVKGVQDGPKKKAIRQAVQGFGGKGGPVRGNDGQRPIGGTRHKELDAKKMGP